MNVTLKRFLKFLPAMILGGILLLLYQSLRLPPNETPQQENAFPTFSLADIRTPTQQVSTDNLKGSVKVVHVWATWCGVCVKEHSDWLQIKNKWPFDLVGIVYRDDANKVNHLMKEKGDPYQFLMNDDSGSLGLALGLMGTPETFVVDKNGVIRFHLYGPVDVSRFEKDILPVLQRINEENA